MNDPNFKSDSDDAFGVFSFFFFFCSATMNEYLYTGSECSRECVICQHGKYTRKYFASKYLSYYLGGKFTRDTQFSMRVHSLSKISRYRITTTYVH